VVSTVDMALFGTIWGMVQSVTIVIVVAFSTAPGRHEGACASSSPLLEKSARPHLVAR
jgi:hypothetical protein